MSFNCLGPEVAHHFLSQSIGQQGRLGNSGQHLEYCHAPYVLIPHHQAENIVCVAGWSLELVI